MNSIETIEKIESTNSNISLQGEEYQIELILFSNNFIEFRVKLSNPTASCYYTEKYNFEQIKELGYLHYNEIKNVFDYYQRKLENKKINLSLSENKDIMYLNYRTIVNDEDVKDIKLELKKVILKKDDFVEVLTKEVEQLKLKNNELVKTIEELKKNNNEIKNNFDLLMNEYNKKIEKEKQEERRKKDEEKNEEKLKKDEENFLALNDNINLTNNFEFKNFENIEAKYAIPVNEIGINTVAVYCIIKNNKRIYQMAYPEHNFYDKYTSAYIIIYNLISNKIDNRIKIEKGYDGRINNIKHYYDSDNKIHYLLSTFNYGYFNSDYNCSYRNQNKLILWKIISSNCIEQYLNIKIDDYKYRGNKNINACLLFLDNNNFNIFGGFTSEKMCSFNQKGNLMKTISNSQIDDYRNFIEAVYIKIKNEEKKYILLSGYESQSKSYICECYDLGTSEILTYRTNDAQSQIGCINLFKKDDIIYLISTTNDKVNIFDFKSTKPIKVILMDECAYSLCSISQKYLIVSSKSKLKIIDMEKKTVDNKFSLNAVNDGVEYTVTEIKKIKIPEIGELIITYTQDCIKIWKI